MLPQKLVFVDLETTGTSVTRDRIIEIGIIRVENNKLVKSFQSLVNPQGYISPYIETLTGIKRTELVTAPVFNTLKKEIMDLLKDAVFIAHNARFDYSFLKHEFKRQEIDFKAKQLCTVKLSRKLYPRFYRHDLDSLIKRFDLSCLQRHRAYDDAKAIYDLFSLFKKTFPEEKIEETINILLKKPSLPMNLALKELEDLPESPGVYIFYGDDNTPLYVGKSINIKERVMSHFSDLSSSREINISQQVNNIKVIKTCGELGALIEESMLIKKLQPIYNRKLRHSRKLVILQKITNGDGYDTITINEVNNIELSDTNKILGIFKSKRQAKDFLSEKAKEHSLCEKVLGLQNTKSACFSHHLGICKGACIKKELPIKYNLRFLQAFSDNKIKQWPFKGPIVIKEESQLDESKDSFVINKWCLIGKIKYNGFSLEKNTLENKYFDLDIYKIIQRFIYSKNKASINSLPEQEIEMLF